MAIKIGGTGSDTLTGTSLFDALIGGRGNDTFIGSGGLDAFDGGFGTDSVDGGATSFLFEGGAGKDSVSLLSGPWQIALNSYGAHFQAGLINTKTGQIVALNDVETVSIGSTSHAFTLLADKTSSFTGTSAADYIISRNGSDTIKAGAGNDWIVGGAGADKIDAGSGNDFIDKSNLGELTKATRSTITAGEGHDVIMASIQPYGNYAKYTIDGGTGNDTVYLTDVFSAQVSLTLSGSTTTMSFSDFSQPTTTVGTLTGVEQVVNMATGGVFTLSGSTWVEARKIVTVGKATSELSEEVRGGSGSDVLKGNGGFDHFKGGAGTDTVVLSGRAEMWTTSGNSFDFSRGAARLNNNLDPHNPAVLIGADIEKLSFESGGTPDVYSFKVLTSGSFAGATSGNNFLVVASSFSSSITANQTYSLEGGNDFLYGMGNVTKLDGGTGNDTISWHETGAGATLVGGTGNDRLSLSGSSSSGTWRLDGGDGNDQINFSGPAKATITGGAGDDMIVASSTSKIFGGAGNDLITTFFGNGETGLADGGAGDDVVTLTGTSGDYSITKSGTDFVVTDKYSGGSMTLSNVEAVRFSDKALDLTKSFSTYVGSGAVDSKTGTSAIDLMHGGLGNDTLSGGSGHDTVAGDGGNDTLNGGSGDDFIFGGIGNDTMTGGADVDIFYFQRDYLAEGKDIITDFTAGAGLGDVISFSSNYELDSYEDVMKLAKQVGGNTVISFDNGDTITLTGVVVTNLVADDFLF